MRVSASIASAVLFALSFGTPGSVLGDSRALQKQLNTYPLPDNSNSADISPDEQWVVTESTTMADASNATTRTFTDVVQLWNFREDRLVSAFNAERVDVEASPRGFFRGPARGAHIVRYSPDGNLVVALIGQTIHVLRATDLSELRTIALVGPGNTTRTIHGHTIVNVPRVTAAEISPSGNAVAVLWVGEYLDGKIELYDLSSGRSTQSWNTPQGWVTFTRGLAWHPDGQLLLIAIPNETPCGSPNNQPDVFAFDAQTGNLKYKFSTGLLTVSIAVTADNRVLAVDGDCMGVLKDRNPKLRVFDLITGKHLRDVSGRETGVRYLVSASADGSRFLGFTGKMKTKFDWVDFVSNDAVVDRTFSVWNLNTYDEVVTSQDIPGLNPAEGIPGLNPGTIRLSSKGRYAVSVGKSSAVYELP
jgi:WD40 repeat protein